MKFIENYSGCGHAPTALQNATVVGNINAMRAIREGWTIYPQHIVEATNVSITAKQHLAYKLLRQWEAETYDFAPEYSDDASEEWEYNLQNDD